MIIKLVDFSGEFCTNRKNEGLIRVIAELKKALQSEEKVIISSNGVKILTPSYIDELIPPLAIEFGVEKVEKMITFSPPLTGFLLEQLNRGVKNRTGR